jgi:hypothetical protein
VLKVEGWNESLDGRLQQKKNDKLNLQLLLFYVCYYCTLLDLLVELA